MGGVAQIPFNQAELDAELDAAFEELYGPDWERGVNIRRQPSNDKVPIAASAGPSAEGSYQEGKLE